MSKFNVFNDDNIKKQPDAKPKNENVQDQENRNTDEARISRPPIIMGRIVDADLIRREMAPRPVYAPAVTLSRILTATLGLPDNMEASVMVGDDEFTLLRPIVGNRYYNSAVIEFTISAPGQYLRLRSLRALAHNSTDMSAIFRFNGRDIIDIEVGSRLIMRT